MVEGKNDDTLTTHELANTINAAVDKRFGNFMGPLRKSEKSRYATRQHTDVSYLQAQKTILAENEAKMDSLTGLLRQDSFSLAYSKALKEAQNNSLRLIFTAFDIDYFKTFNDTHGHQMGDLLLAALGKTLQQNMRSTDILGRIGGEEFAAVGVPQAHETNDKRTSPRTLSEAFDSGLAVAEKIRTTVPQIEITDLNGNKINGVTISCGLTFSTPNESPDRIRLRTDVALYLAKAHGRNCLVVAMPQPDESTVFYLATPKPTEQISAEAREHFDYTQIKIVPNQDLTKIKDIVR